MLQRTAERLQFLLHQAAGISGQELCQRLGRGMRTVRRRKRIVHIDIGEFRKLGGKIRIVQFLAFVIAQVFEQHDVARLRRTDDLLRFGTDAVIGKRNIPSAKRCRQRTGQWCQRHLGHRLSLGAAKMGSNHDNRALIRQFRDGRCET